MFIELGCIKRVSLKKVFAVFMLAFFGVLYLAPLALAAGGEGKVVEDFADFMIDILTGPVSKLLAVVILITGVVNLFRGRVDIAVGCAFAFLILMFLPKLIESFK